MGSGLQLSFAANRAIGRASIYVGLLYLAALGPAVLFGLGFLVRMRDLGIDLFMGSGDLAPLVQADPALAASLGAATTILSLVTIGGALLIVAISIDAQAIAISLLGSHAAGTLLRLREAVTRARQVFWRLLGATILVGICSNGLSLLLQVTLLSGFRSEESVAFVASAVATLAVTPFAFAAAGVVLGNVGPIETLRRSVRLFRARPSIALVVVLFTLVTSGIQVFAMLSGLDLAMMLGEALHLGLDSGVPALAALVAAVLALVVAFGSLSFTVGAIVAAPQVAGFLGLTHYAAGLDGARSSEPIRRRLWWVSPPMTVAMVVIAALSLLGAPALGSLAATPLARATPAPTLPVAGRPSPRSTPKGGTPIESARQGPSGSLETGGLGSLVEYLRSQAADHRQDLVGPDEAASVSDPAGDQSGEAAPEVDIVLVEYLLLDSVPDWLFVETFTCSAPTVACSEPWTTPYDQGALVFHARVAGAPSVVAPGDRWQWGPVLALDRYYTVPPHPDAVLSGASHVFATQVRADRRAIYQQRPSGLWVYEGRTAARSVRITADLVVLIPLPELDTSVVGWDFHVLLGPDGGPHTARDTLRTTYTEPLLPFDDPPLFFFVP